MIKVRDRLMFICEYTGAPCDKRYFIPTGKTSKGKEGCFSTLPVLLRAVLEEEGGNMNHRFYSIKKRLEDYFDQPDIPVHPPLDIQKVPLSKDELQEYLLEMEMGMAWLQVGKAETIENARGKPVNKRQKVRE